MKKYMDLLESATQKGKSQEDTIQEELFLVFQQDVKKHFGDKIESSGYEFVYNGTDKNNGLVDVYYLNDESDHKISISFNIDVLSISDNDYDDEEATEREKRNKVVVSLYLEGTFSVFFEADVGDIEITSVPVSDEYGLVVEKHNDHLGPYWDSLLDTKSEQDIVDNMNILNDSHSYSSINDVRGLQILPLVMVLCPCT